jgi:broad specificity phosphatase PhoE
MKIRYVLVPHGSKMPAREAIAHGFSPADPPLTEKAKGLAHDLCYELREKFGQPDIIFCSPKIRARQTAERAIKCYGQLQNGGCLVVELNSLCQPDSGEVDHENSTRPDGLVIYGDPSTDAQWHEWTYQSFELMEAIVGVALRGKDEVTVWVYTHSPHTACARRMARLNATDDDADTIPTDGEMAAEALDPTIKPYIVIEVAHSGGLFVEVTDRHR